MKSESRAPHPASTNDTASKVITVEAARRELARRRLPRGQRKSEGREQAITDGTFFATKKVLEVIAAEVVES